MLHAILLTFHSPSTFQIFSNCRCTDAGDTVSREFCKDDCTPMIYAYFIVAALSSLIGGFACVPGVLIVLRWADKAD